MPTPFHWIACALAAPIIAAAMTADAPAANPAPTMAPRSTPTLPASTAATQNLGTISGRVTFDNGKPAAGLTVTAFPAAVPFDRFDKTNPNVAVTDAEGRYTITLRPMNAMTINGPILFNAKGDTVLVSSGGQGFIPPPPQTVDPAALPGQAASNINFVLRLGPQITVRIQDAITGAPDVGVPVAYQDLTGSRVPAGVTGPGGTLQFRVPLTQFWLHADLPPSLQAAPGYGSGNELEKQITAAPGQAITWEIKTYQGGENGYSNWHGVVLGPNGKPVGGATVAIYRQNWGSGAATADSQGRFSLTLLRYRFEETPQARYGPPPVIVARSGSLVAAQTVTPDESWDGMTLRLAPGAVVTGEFTDPQGHPAAGMDVAAVGSILGITPGKADTPDATTDHDGRFTLAGLPPGIYDIRAQGGGYGTEIVPPTISGLSPSRQSYIPLKLGERRDVGLVAVPRADRTLTGTVVDDHGQPVNQIEIGVTGDHCQETVFTDKDGRFYAYNLVREPLAVQIGQLRSPDTVTVGAAQNEVRLVATPALIAAHAVQPAPTPTPTPAAAAPAPRGPLKVVTNDGGVGRLDGLQYAIRPMPEGGAAAAITRMDPGNSGMMFPISLMRASFPFEIGSAPSHLLIWHGSLADLEGMRLDVRHDQGRLTDRAGHLLWQGAIVAPPDYVILHDDSRPHAETLSLLDAHGKTLWSGPVASFNGLQIGDGVLRLIRPDHTVAFQLSLGNARVIEQWTFPPRKTVPAYLPPDASLTLHVVTVRAALTSAAGASLWTGSAPAVTVAATGFPPPAARLAANAPPPPDAQRPDLWYDPLVPLLSLQNPPPGFQMAFTDANGRPLPNATSVPYAYTAPAAR